MLRCRALALHVQLNISKHTESNRTVSVPVLLDLYHQSFIPFHAIIFTLNCEHQLFGVDQRHPLVWALFPSLSVSPSPLALAPKVGATVHAGNVENGNAFQGDTAEVQSDTITLNEQRGEDTVIGKIEFL